MQSSADTMEPEAEAPLRFTGIMPHQVNAIAPLVAPLLDAEHRHNLGDWEHFAPALRDGRMQLWIAARTNSIQMACLT